MRLLSVAVLSSALLLSGSSLTAGGNASPSSNSTPAIFGFRDAAAESDTEACPAGSQIGTATSAVGPGREPYVASEGRVYLTGPYKDGPFGLKVEVPSL